MHWFQKQYAFLYGSHAAPQYEQLSDIPHTKRELTPLEGERILTVQFNGTRYELDTKLCTGGVVFSRPVLLEEICVRGNYDVRASFCNRWDSMKIGLPGKSDCLTIHSEIQSLHPNFAYAAPSTTPTAFNPVVISGSPPTTDEKVIPFKPTLSPMFGASLLDDDLNPNVTKSEDETQVERNSLLKKRQTPMDDTDQDDFGNEDYEEAPSPDSLPPAPPDGLPPAPPDGLPPAPPDMMQPPVDETAGMKHSEEEDPKEDLLPVNEGSETKVPGLLAVGDKIVNDQIVEDSGQMLPEQGQGEGSSLHSSENDDLGEWENLNDVLAQVEYHPLPKRNTLEYDVVTGGMNKWFMESPSPIFDSQITVLRAQIAQSLGLAPLSGMGGDAQPTSSVLEPVQPQNMTWYKLLEKAALVADHLVPTPLIPDRRADAGGETSQGFKLPFFYHALMIFGYFTRTLQEEDVDVGMEDDQDFWNFVLEGMNKCVESSSSEINQKKFVMAGKKAAAGASCDRIAELELSKILGMKWDDETSNFNVYNYSINYTHSLDPNSYLPPHSARINPRLWIFAELMWYSVQISYAYCFLPFSESSPDSFMMAYAKLIKIFESQTVQNLWSDSAESSGGNLNVYENFLPFIQHSAFGDANLLSNSEDFKRVLVSLDKVSFAVHEESLLNHWIQRPSKRGLNDKEEFGGGKRYWDDPDNKKKKRRRRRRAADNDEEASNPQEESTWASVGDGNSEVLGVVKVNTETEEPIVVNFERVVATNSPEATKNIQESIPEAEKDTTQTQTSPPITFESALEAEARKYEDQTISEASQALKDLIKPIEAEKSAEKIETVSPSVVVVTIPPIVQPETTLNSIIKFDPLVQPVTELVKNDQDVLITSDAQSTIGPKVYEQAEVKAVEINKEVYTTPAIETVKMITTAEVSPEEVQQPPSPTLSAGTPEEIKVESILAPIQRVEQISPKNDVIQNAPKPEVVQVNANDNLKPDELTKTLTQEQKPDQEVAQSDRELGVAREVSNILASSTPQNLPKQLEDVAIQKIDEWSLDKTKDSNTGSVIQPISEVLLDQKSTVTPEAPKTSKTDLSPSQITASEAKTEQVLKRDDTIEPHVPEVEMKRDESETATEAIFAPALEAEIMRTSDLEKHLDSRNLETQQHSVAEIVEQKSEIDMPIQPSVLIPTDDIMEGYGKTPAVGIYLEPTNAPIQETTTTLSEISKAYREIFKETQAKAIVPVSQIVEDQAAIIPPKVSSSDSKEHERRLQSNVDEFKIWNGIAYCLILKEDNQGKDTLDTTPSFRDLESTGICRDNDRL